MNKKKVLCFGIVASSLVSILFAIVISAFVFTPNFSVLMENENRAHIEDGKIYIGSFEDYDSEMLKYEYSVPKNSEGTLLINPDKPEDYLLKFINSEYLIVTFKDDNIHNETLQKHKLDQLVFLNDATNKTDVLYECFGQDRILYGNKEFVIVYNSEHNSVQYILLEDKKVFDERVLNLNKLGYYSIWVKESENSITIEQHPVFSSDTKIIAELEITDNTRDGSPS